MGKAKVLVKVLRYFPLIPRLAKMFSTSLQASFITWHARNLSDVDIVSHAVDSHKLKWINN